MHRPKSPESRLVNYDLDGVIFDFEGAINTALKGEFPDIELADPRTHFYVFKHYQNPEVVDFIKDTQNSKGFFANLTLIEGALEAWQNAQELGFYNRVCSAPLTDNPWCTEEKLEAIDRHFGHKAADEAFIGKDKAGEPGIALIDDKPGLTDGLTWKRIIFSQPYNIMDEGYRIDGWHDPTLPAILANCAARYHRISSSK